MEHWNVLGSLAGSGLHCRAITIIPPSQLAVCMVRRPPGPVELRMCPSSFSALRPPDISSDEDEGVVFRRLADKVPESVTPNKRRPRVGTAARGVGAAGAAAGSSAGPEVASPTARRQRGFGHDSSVASLFEGEEDAEVMRTGEEMFFGYSSALDAASVSGAQCSSVELS